MGFHGEDWGSKGKGKGGQEERKGRRPALSRRVRRRSSGQPREAEGATLQPGRGRQEKNNESKGGRGFSVEAGRIAGQRASRGPSEGADLGRQVLLLEHLPLLLVLLRTRPREFAAAAKEQRPEVDSEATHRRRPPGLGPDAGLGQIFSEEKKSGGGGGREHWRRGIPGQEGLGLREVGQGGPKDIQEKTIFRSLRRHRAMRLWTL